MTEMLAVLTAQKQGRTFTGDGHTLKLAKFLTAANACFEKHLQNATHAEDRMVAQAGLLEVARTISTYGGYDPGKQRDRSIHFCVERIYDSLRYFNERDIKIA